MITLKEVAIQKYKCFDELRSFIADPKVTVLIGMNEAGKTALLEAIAKTNYFTDDKQFLFNATLDYPRKELKEYSKRKETVDVVKCTYKVSNELIESIEDDIGEGLFPVKEFVYSKNYENKDTWAGISVDKTKFLKAKVKQYNLKADDIANKVYELNTLEEINTLLESAKEEVEDLLKDLSKYFENEWDWSNPIEEYVIRVWIKPNIPKYMYYSEYYSLPSRINLHDLQAEGLEEEPLKTSKALFELADINIDELMDSDNYESYIAELEATSNLITRQIFKYWSTNKNLRIKFDIDKQERGNKLIPILDIRVENLNYMITLPLKNRSKGFNWFFSFIVWFSKIQEDKESNYILLLDEPAINLHASAQEDLLNFIEDLSKDYQIIYTSHSPFMVDSDHLERVRTLVETDQGTRISDSIQEKDPKTLFPLQAALGYNIAQNLFISKHNLLVEGPADLLYLTIMSNLLQSETREGLKERITIVPVGGLDKVSTFISLLRGNKLDIVCLLDSFDSSKGKQKVEDLVRSQIIRKNKIRFFHEFIKIKGDKADIEDLFTEEEYLRIFNSAFKEHPDIDIKELDTRFGKIVTRINKHLKIPRFNHYRPANILAQMAVKKDFFNETTLKKFENVFKEINQLFDI